MRKSILVFTVLILAALACNLPGTIAQNATPVAVAQVLVTPDQFAAPTATPFRPIAPTATSSSPTEVPTPVFTEEPTFTPTPETPSGAIPKGQVNILVLGSDWRAGMGSRTDVIVWVSIDTTHKTVSLISFPRDLYVSIPGYGMERINTAQAYGDFPLTQATFETNFGVRPDYYFMTTFQGFVGIINSLGGIDVNAQYNLTDHCKLPIGVDNQCSVGPGVVHMDGDTALWYVRSRYSTSDFDRTRRAQEVLGGVFSKLMSLNAVARAPEIYQQYLSSVETNMDISAILPLLEVAPYVFDHPEAIRRYAVGPGEAYDYITDGGAWVLIPNQGAILEIIRQALYLQ